MLVNHRSAVAKRREITYLRPECVYDNSHRARLPFPERNGSLALLLHDLLRDKDEGTDHVAARRRYHVDCGAEAMSASSEARFHASGRCGRTVRRAPQPSFDGLVRPEVQGRRRNRADDRRHDATVETPRATGPSNRDHGIPCTRELPRSSLPQRLRAVNGVQQSIRQAAGEPSGEGGPHILLNR